MFKLNNIQVSQKDIDYFSRILNHELRTPFAVVNSSLHFTQEIIEALVKKDDNSIFKEFDKEYLDKVLNAISNSIEELKNAELFLNKITDNFKEKIVDIPDEVDVIKVFISALNKFNLKDILFAKPISIKIQQFKCIKKINMQVLLRAFYYLLDNFICVVSNEEETFLSIYTDEVRKKIIFILNNYNSSSFLTKKNGYKIFPDENIKKLSEGMRFARKVFNEIDGKINTYEKNDEYKLVITFN